MNRIFTSILSAALLLTACQMSDLSTPSSEEGFLYATIEEVAATKTYMDVNNNIRWSEGDQIVGFMKSSLGLKYQILPSSVGKTYASFENISDSNDYINAGIEWDHNVVYYPYSGVVEAQKLGSNYSLSVSLPAEQTYAEDSFGNGSMAMVAVGEDNNITFRNILGGMKLQLRGTQKVKSIKFEGKNNEKLAGPATVTAYTDETKPAITMAQSASTSVTLDCGSGVQLNESAATEFIIALPPVLFSNGFIITVTDSDQQEYTVESTVANTVLRSSLLVMPEVSLGEDSDQEDFENDWLGITTTDAGTVKDVLSEHDPLSIKNLSITGPIDARDFNFIKWNCLNLENIDLSETRIECYSGDQGTNEGYYDVFPENEIPLGAFFYWISNYGDKFSDEGMPTLKSVKLPHTIKAIRRNAFARAYRLTNINFPEGLEVIDYVALSFCTSLEMVELPSTLKEIGLWAFHNMNALKEVHCKAVVPPSLDQSFCWIGDWSEIRGALDYSFYNSDPQATLYVPEGSLLAYQRSEWSEFFDRIVEE